MMIVVGNALSGFGDFIAEASNVAHGIFLTRFD